jgi:hypothetical protein
MVAKEGIKVKMLNSMLSKKSCVTLVIFHVPIVYNGKLR